jgi:hypothetical protein
VSNIDDLNLSLKVTHFPTVVTIKEGLDPVIYNDTNFNYLHMIAYMRQLYNKNKIEKIMTDKQL